jgi:hypothetical protein
MKYTKALLTLALLIFTFSCGSSWQELAANNKSYDSMREVGRNQVEVRQVIRLDTEEGRANHREAVQALTLLGVKDSLNYSELITVNEFDLEKKKVRVHHTTFKSKDGRTLYEFDNDSEWTEYGVMFTQIAEKLS